LLLFLEKEDLATIIGIRTYIVNRLMDRLIDPLSYYAAVGLGSREAGGCQLKEKAPSEIPLVRGDG
jgi:hypothetical protein